MQTDELEDFEELEEGEVSSDEDGPPPVGVTDELSVDYDPLPRPVAFTQSLLQQGSSRTVGVDPHYQQPLRPSRPDPFKSQLLHNRLDDEDEDGKYDKSSSGTSDDSDDDGPSGRKCRRMPDTHFKPTFGGTSLGGSVSFAFGSTNTFTSAMPFKGNDNNDAFKSQAVVFQEKRRPNNVWSTVLQDEQVSDIFGKVNVDEYDDMHVLVDRGPETFSVKYKNRPPVRQRSDSSSLSSGGLTDDELEYLRGNAEDSLVQGDRNEPRETRGKQFGPTLAQRRVNAQKRNQRRKRKNRMVRKMNEMTPEMLGEYMAKKLTEPKFHLMTNCIKQLGAEPCISLFLKTMKIERRGGLMIMNQQRRRTPGGVFFYLLRGDRRFSKKLVDRIFESDRQHQLQSRKRDRHKKRLKSKAKLEEKKTLHEGVEKNDGESSIIQVNQEEMEGDDGLAVGADESDVDSDEFYGIQGTAADGVTNSRTMVDYEDQDYVDIYCDPTDLN